MSLIFLLTHHFSSFQILPLNWKHLINHRMQGKKVFWHAILHSYLCNTLCKFFLSKSKVINVFQKDILKLKARDQSVQARKKHFCQVIVNNYLCPIFVTMLGLSERATIAILKNFAFVETPLLKPIFKKVTDL